MKVSVFLVSLFLVFSVVSIAKADIVHLLVDSCIPTCNFGDASVWSSGRVPQSGDDVSVGPSTDIANQTVLIVTGNYTITSLSITTAKLYINGPNGWLSVYQDLKITQNGDLQIDQGGTLIKPPQSPGSFLVDNLSRLNVLTNGTFAIFGTSSVYKGVLAVEIGGRFIDHSDITVIQFASKSSYNYAPVQFYNLTVQQCVARFNSGLLVTQLTIAVNSSVVAVNTLQIYTSVTFNDVSSRLTALDLTTADVGPSFIGDSSNLSIFGPGKFYITNSVLNLYSKYVTILNCTLIFTGQNTVLISDFMLSGSNLQFPDGDTGNSFAFSWSYLNGPMQINGAATVVSSSFLYTEGPITFTGCIDVDGGTLLMANGSLTCNSTDLRVMDGGSFGLEDSLIAANVSLSRNGSLVVGGVNYLIGDLHNHGLVRSTQYDVLSISGDYIQAKDGVLLASIDKTHKSQGAAAGIMVSGAASLDGTLQTYTSTALVDTATYYVLQSQGTITGNFKDTSKEANSKPADFALQVTDHFVILTFNAKSGGTTTGGGKKPFHKTGGFVALMVILPLVVVGAAVGGYIYWKRVRGGYLSINQN